MKRLVVTADDFGLAREVNEAVEIAHAKGILTSASLMVGAPWMQDAVARARRLPTLRVGLHLVLVDGEPVLAASRVPDLVDDAGRFRDDMTRLGIEIFTSAAVRRQVAMEIEAQFAAFARTGLTLDHVNAHRHYHLHPSIARLVVTIGRRYGMRSVRVPSEPAAAIRAIDPATPRPRTLWPYTSLLRRRVVRAGLATTDRVYGYAWSGAMTADRVEALIRRLPSGSSELYLHPATADRFAGSCPGYAYTAELAALTSARCIDAARDVETRVTGAAATTARDPRSAVRDFA